MKATFRQSLSWSTLSNDFLMVLPVQYPFWLKFWHVEGNVWVLLTQKGLNMKQWNGCVNWKGEKIQTNPHRFDFHGPPTHSQWSTLVSFSYKKTIKNKSKQPQLLRSQGSRDYFTPDEEEQREKKKRKKQVERREDEPSVCPGSARTLVYHRIHLCSFVGAKYNSMGLLTFQYFSLTSSREKEPFRTC